MTNEEEQEIKELVTSVDGELIKVFEEFNKQLMIVFEPVKETQSAVKINQQAVARLQEYVADLQKAVVKINSRLAVVEQRLQPTGPSNPDLMN